MPGARKIGAAVSGPGIAGGKITDMRLFFSELVTSYEHTLHCKVRAQWPPQPATV